MDICCPQHVCEIRRKNFSNYTNVYIHMLAGSCSGLTEHVSIFPLDTIKTHIQSNNDCSNINSTILNLYRDGGLIRFWRGVSIIAVASIPAHSAYFSAYEFAKKKFGLNRKGFQFLSSAITGAFATFFHDLILTPCDVIKQRMQLTGSKKYFTSINLIAKKEGVWSLYRSLPITILMNGPYMITTIIVNENLKKIFIIKKDKHQFSSYFICASFAGSVASIITTPLDNIKTKLQTQTVIPKCKDNKQNKSVHECGIISNVKYKDILSTVRLIYKEQGIINGFSRGMIPRVICNALSCAVSWGTYEIFKHFLIEKFDSRECHI